MVYQPDIITSLDDVLKLIPPDIRGRYRKEFRDIQPVVEKYGFFAPRSYLENIDWRDPKDPVKRIIIPSKGELIDWDTIGLGKLDASNEARYRPLQDKGILGFQHKYPDTVIMLVNDACGGQCRVCFRKRLFRSEDTTYSKVKETLTDDQLPDVYGYIASDSMINNVLVSGGDPLMMKTNRLDGIVSNLSNLENIHVIRMGTKMPAFDPDRILDDPELVDMVEHYINEDNNTTIYFMTHFDNPRELTPKAKMALKTLKKTGATLYNQTPMMKGVNDNPKVLSMLFRELSYNGVTPYYVFQCRPTEGNRDLSVPIERGYHIFEEAKHQCSGTAQTAAFAMSHEKGKIQVTGLDPNYIYMELHRGEHGRGYGPTIKFPRNPAAMWFDDYMRVVEFTPSIPNTSRVPLITGK